MIQISFFFFFEVILKFPTQFWKEDVNSFGFVRPKSYEEKLLKEDNLRGEGFLFWNLQPLKEKPILAAFFCSSDDGTKGSEEEMKNKTLDILKKVCHFLCFRFVATLLLNFCLVKVVPTPASTGEFSIVNLQ